MNSGSRPGEANPMPMRLLARYRALPKLHPVRRMARVIGLLSAALATFLFFLWLCQNSLIYFPGRYEDGWKPGEGRTSRFRPYQTAKGQPRWGCLIEATKPGPASNFYIVFGGNASRALEFQPYFEEMARRTGRGFFIVDYTGYGFNDGSPSEPALVADALGAYDTMKAEGRLEAGVGVFGVSLGGAAAFALASARPVDDLIVLSTFTTMDDMARLKMGWPICLLCANHWPNLARIAELAARPPESRPRRITLFHGKLDEIIPFSMGERLAAASRGWATFIPVEGAHHPDVHEVAQGKIADLFATGVEKN